ncbi:SRPBCC family protein [Streptacidiphilus fuscans]|uniref:SRPBCC family protein n=1 Tax=Streptacidiphilus fuscans TaxID=2789292 RepID=A0A931F9T6_9ACTN|nr:SRPBCC family protein [Streptacidiphilus fuscans]MBF9066962.1 SRPBCC family protein [Streptacidiphilus fuscans]
MSRLEEQITIDAPAREVWDRLHDVESYPAFMAGVERARAHGRHHAHLDVRTKDERRREFEAVMADRGGDQVITWQTEGSPELKGDIVVRPLDPDHSQLQIRVAYEPDAIHDAFGGPKGMAQVHRIENTVRGDLEQFKSLVEAAS